MEDVLEIIRRMWGFDSLRPLQEEAIRAGIDGRDSLVVLPTGGGKSLCYQVPPLATDRLDVVVSPLISLMKDQVDALRQNGYPAAALHSNLENGEAAAVHRALDAGGVRLLFVSPERLMVPGFSDRLRALGVRAFAIDEAHCISHWGHDFRPEYRQLAELRERVPGASVHAFTATATERVRDDIARALRLDDPAVLVGRFDRENLIYRVVPGYDVRAQVLDALSRHDGEAAIVYCLSRKDTEELAEGLREAGVRAAHYHAGMSKRQRTRTQDDFAADRVDVVVATVAFGMGIDRSDVRCVIHASLPKSVEHYQQETGRAGRDGLAAECLLLYSYADVIRWQHLLERSFEESGGHGEVLSAQLDLLDGMKRFAGVLQCRHRALSRYFGQEYDAADCGACDVCLGEVSGMPESTTIAQKILSGVARLEQRFGVGYVVKVLRGADTEDVRRRGHDALSTWGILADVPEKALTNLVYQLVDQGLLLRTPGDRPVLRLTRDAVAVLRGEREVHLVEPPSRKRPARRTRKEEADWADVDTSLFEALRALRAEIARERGVPAYVVFGDRTLREMAALRPSSPAALAGIHGVGEKKLKDLGPRFLDAIAAFRAGA